MNILILIWSKQRLQAHEEWKCRTSMRVFCVVGEHWHLLGSHIQHKKVGISLPYWPELHVDIASPRRQDAYPLHPLSTADLLHPVNQQGEILFFRKKIYWAVDHVSYHWTSHVAWYARFSECWCIRADTTITITQLDLFSSHKSPTYKLKMK